MKIFLRTAAMIMFMVATPVTAEVMNNQSVLSLAHAGLSDELVIAKVDSEPCNYDVSTNAILALRAASLSDKVIAAMVMRCAASSHVRGVAGDDASADPLVRHTPGVYVMEDWQRPIALQLVRPSKAGGMKTSGNGSIVFPLLAKMVMPTGTSRVPVGSPNPTFYFYFNPSDPNVSDFGQEQSLAAQSPDEFSLIKFKQKGDTRELEVGRASSFDGSLVSFRKGMSSKGKIKFDSEDKGSGIYKVSLNSLQPGEYAFVFTAGNGNSRIYDFTILPSAIAKP